MSFGESKRARSAREIREGRVILTDEQGHPMPRPQRDEFTTDLDIAPLVNGEPITKTEQTKMCGNSVCPPIAAALVAANVGKKAARVA